MKILPILVMSLFLGGSISAQDVRGLTWGMSKEKVKSIEGSQAYVPGKTNGGMEYFFYQGRVGGLDCGLVFYFVDNKLLKINYIFTETHVSKNLYKDDFYAIGLVLDKKYGAKETEFLWKDELYKNDPKDWGMAIAAGHLVMYALYENERTIVDHTIRGDNFKISHTIVFESKELANLAEKTAEDQTKDF